MNMSNHSVALLQTKITHDDLDVRMKVFFFSSFTFVVILWKSDAENNYKMKTA